MEHAIMSSPPLGFTWIEPPFLAAMAMPQGQEELDWLKQQGIEIILSLTEWPLDEEAVAQAGLLAYHVPVPDMQPPPPSELRRCISALERARRGKLGVAVHCGAGLGRTGVVLACWFVSQGATADDAIRKVRSLRPGSIETSAQEDAVHRFAEGR